MTDNVNNNNNIIPKKNTEPDNLVEEISSPKDELLLLNSEEKAEDIGFQDFTDVPAQPLEKKYPADQKTTSEDFSFVNDVLGHRLPFQRLNPGVIWRNEAILKHKYYTVKGSKIDLNNEIEEMQKNTKCFGGSNLEDYERELKEAEDLFKNSTVQKKPLVWVEDNDCLVVGYHLEKKYNQRPLILNLAQRWSGHICGKYGNAFYGSQEESIERRSAVYRLSLDPQLNPHRASVYKEDKTYTFHIPRFGTIYSPNVPILRDTHYELFEKFYTADILAIGAIDMRDHSHEKRPNEVLLYRDEKTGKIDWELFRRATKIKVELILISAVKLGKRILVLGALGCGAFKNDIPTVASCFLEVLEDKKWQRGQFDAIVFANKGDRCFTGFHKVLKDFNK